MTAPTPDNAGWITLKPANTGGGRKQNKPQASFSKGQLVLNHAAVALLGGSAPPRVAMQVHPGQARIRLRPTTPGDAGGFALSGGGNAQYRLTCKTLLQWPQFAGRYTVARIAGAIELRKEDD